jgi:two-component system NtrC family response regulator
MANILIIDDDEFICTTLSNLVKGMDHTPICAFTLKEGLAAANTVAFDVVFLDVRLPDGSGLDIVQGIRETPASPEVIIITGFGDVDGAELAIKHGAWDYVEKSASIDEIILPLERALQYRTERQSKARPTALNLEGIVGSSPKMRACIELLAQAAGSDANVLVTGETGTGKELFAWAIHNNSSRTGKNFVVVDCTALPETIVESELFGHERGAFTGADKSKIGLITQAHGGTLFLDEVSELPAPIQGSFLRAIQERRFRPVGSVKEVTSDFRLIAASNRNLDEMVQEGRFRKDLLYRLKTFTITLPPLRGRTEDVQELATYYLAKLSERYGRGMKGFSPEFLDTLLDYDWPGNVRELINALERAIAAAGDSPTLFPTYLPTEIRIKVKRDQVGEADEGIKTLRPAAAGLRRRSLPTIQEHREASVGEAERQYLEELITHTEGDIKEACRVSGLSRSRLYGLLKKHDISTKSLTT